MEQNFCVLRGQNAPQRLINVPRGFYELPIVKCHRIVDLQRAAEEHKVVVIGCRMRPAVFSVDVEPILHTFGTTGFSVRIDFNHPAMNSSRQRSTRRRLEQRFAASINVIVIQLQQRACRMNCRVDGTTIADL